MNKRRILTALTSVVILIFLFGGLAIASDLYVDDDDTTCGGNSPCYSTIQAAINGSSGGNTVHVSAGTYYEHLTINKSLTLQGENRETTIINGSGSGNVIYVSADDVTISGLKITNGFYGIYATIQSNSCNIRNCEISGNNIGLRANWAYYAVVSDNEVHDNGAGIWFDSMRNSTAENNRVFSNSEGIYVGYASYDNIIRNNVVENNTSLGIHVGSNISITGNKIYHNDIIGNPTQNMDNNGVTIWDDGYPSGGNYWSDYTGVDYHSGSDQNIIGSDGIGDTPYEIIDDGGNVRTYDYYPLMSPINTVQYPPIANAGTDQSVRPDDLVTLDGSDSSDPDANYPLTYSWEIINKPENSTASLSDSTTVNPTFTADLPGDYVVELMVIDNIGLSSVPDEVVISTINSAPVAEAGTDQAIIVINTMVHLDGTQSYDDDGDDITYSWSFFSKPEESQAELLNSASGTPSFMADIHGEYVIELVVSDPWILSDPDTVTVSFDNVLPIADAGVNQSVVQGDTVYLDGSNSSDANLDPLTYSWSLASKPEGSITEIDDPTSFQTSFVTDLPGEYIVSLVVNDGFADSDPNNVTIVVISFQDATTETLQDTTAAVNSIDINVLKNKNMQNALTNKINAALKLVDQGQYEEALNKLENDVLLKTNGCADTGSPDKNDWIKDCESQNQVYPLIMEAIEHLMNL